MCCYSPGLSQIWRAERPGSISAVLSDSDVPVSAALIELCQDSIAIRSCRIDVLDQLVSHTPHLTPLFWRPKACICSVLPDAQHQSSAWCGGGLERDSTTTPLDIAGTCGNDIRKLGQCDGGHGKQDQSLVPANRQHWTVGGAAIAAGLMLCGCWRPAEGNEVVRVISVGDGDTLKVSGSSQATKTIRMACIDAPELAQKPHGKHAREALKELLPTGTIAEIQELGKDRYARSVAIVTAQGKVTNVEMVRSGNAFIYWQYLAGCDKESLVKAEKQAKAASKGIWSKSSPALKPWDFRRKRSRETGDNLRSITPARKCSDAKSWEEAQKWLKDGQGNLDTDRDGIACESLKSR